MNEQQSEQRTHWPPVLTDKDVADYLQIPFEPTHIANLRTKANPPIPHLRISVDKQTLFRYPLDELREWIKGRTKSAMDAN